MTRLVKPGVANALAVLVIKNATPGSVKEKDAGGNGCERRCAGRGQSYLSRFDRVGLDSDDTGTEYGDLGRRLRYDEWSGND